MLSDREFIKEFEQTSLDPCYFNHLGHVRISWLYLKQYQTELAIDRVASGINRYATSLGALDKFHVTMTVALVRIIAGRMQESSTLNWPEFVQANPDLFNNAKKLLGEYYSFNLIESESARIEYLEPDKRDF